MRVAFADLHFEITEEWTDINDDLPPDAPATLALPDGVGVIQFTAARHAGGGDPPVTLDDLAAMNRNLRATLGVGSVAIAAVEGSQCLCVGGTTYGPTEVWGIWYLSDGRNVALITYMSMSPASAKIGGELATVVEVVRSVTF